MNLGSVHGFVHGLVYGLVHGLVHGLVYGTWFIVSLTIFLTLRSTWGFYLNHLIPLRPFKSVFDNVLLEHGGLPHVLPLAVHLIFLPEQVEGVILSHFYSLSFLVRGLRF